ncbi:hypothetical protein F5Y17DRAFT_443388 [Xylariaceae sp. FL0594]|nr:hypothetical protein F5Y17DRAFT_443388 [Xylariaceae sp. FL0594]
MSNLVLCFPGIVRGVLPLLSWGPQDQDTLLFKLLLLRRILLGLLVQSSAVECGRSVVRRGRERRGLGEVGEGPLYNKQFRLL